MLNLREQLKQIAQETLKIQQQGFYVAPSGNSVDISNAQKLSEEKSYLISPDEGRKLSSVIKIDITKRAIIEVRNVSTISAIIDKARYGSSVAVLNFASARNPGGGFLKGSMSQEEALAYSSGLYNSQIRHMEYYESNKKCKSMMYTDNAIYSPDVVFFRNADLDLLEKPVTASVLTLPAVNMKQVITKGEDINEANKVMKYRMRLVLSIFAKNKNKVIILGAYGCGVFGNDPNEIAAWWKDMLIDKSYGCLFDTVVFAVLDKLEGSNISAFEQTFKDFY